MKLARILPLAKSGLFIASACLLLSSVEAKAQIARNIYNATVRAIVTEVNPSGVVGGPCKDTIAFTLNGIVPIDSPIPGDPSFLLDPVSPRLNDMYALLMLAYATGRTVQVITAVPVRKACNAVIAESLTVY